MVGTHNRGGLYMETKREGGGSRGPSIHFNGTPPMTKFNFLMVLSPPKRIKIDDQAFGTWAFGEYLASKS
jgi:hypothetical protein